MTYTTITVDVDVDMDDELIISRQAKEIYALSDRVKELEDRIHDAKLHMICIGGPLNDNKLQFNKEQRQVFHNIMQELGD